MPFAHDTPTGRVGQALRALPARLRNAFLDAAKAFPHRTIVRSDHTPYLTRYSLGQVGRWTVLLHHFHQGDQDPRCHDHPWDMSFSLMLAGGYLETRLGAHGYLWNRVVRPGALNIIRGDDFHRVELIDRDAGAVTIFVTGTRVKSWGFRNHETGVVQPWREALAEQGIPKP